MTKRTPTPAAAAPAIAATDPAQTPAPAAEANVAGEASSAADAQQEGASDAVASELAAQPHAESAPATDGATERVLARVLVAFDGHEPNDVVELTEAELRAHGDQVDPTPAAVEYARSLVE
ncbi:hypothetical protein CA223_05450 [Sphingomonas koreensis]|uniref:Uncharacterized protein n=1 Tax=Sphingomonas koreensis TaxID=93064 RepID=A0A1L6JBQ2_9SPHN|nr:hypothetical protein [Sphingomonas koreensis]APR53358.1 hypothetical protein BRX40_13805 [Sphingomonas koreensis]RSU24520.1 hypothetical protein CA224_02030 [Sphingomonas koreensis]RSU25166.1 hypothetical protein CA222_13625 [Sphingomonas koreensis]RSU30159.1 hypothetical protein CA225_05725 [Sphingomonas koreensis]RSU37404.1 hypothetical protein BRX39_05800 [Sphingomonas koreensis]